MEKHKIILFTEYMGTNYAGWQRQKNAEAVQNVLEDALEKLLKEDINLYGCSRTDAGVHAKNHVSHFLSSTRIPMDKFHLAIAAYLPLDVAVKGARLAEDTFHARFSAIGKQYSYYIWNRPYRSALRSAFSYHEPRPLNLQAMQKACVYFLGEHDFASFMAAGSDQVTTTRTLYSLKVMEVSPGLIRITVHGNAFLYNMVRIIAGTLAYVGLGKLQAEAMPEVISSLDRKQAGITLEPQGLFLDTVYYPEKYDLACYNKSSLSMDLMF